MLKISKTFLILSLTFGMWSQVRAEETSVIDSNAPITEEAQANERQPYPTAWETVGEVGTSKFLVQRFDFHPRNYRDFVHAIRVVGTRASVNITGAEIELANGAVYSLRDLRGLLYQGERIRVNLGYQGVRIRTVRIWATSGNLIGPRGRFRVDLAVEL